MATATIRCTSLAPVKLVHRTSRAGTNITPCYNHNPKLRLDLPGGLGQGQLREYRSIYPPCQGLALDIPPVPHPRPHLHWRPYQFPIRRIPTHRRVLFERGIPDKEQARRGGVGCRRRSPVFRMRTRNTISVKRVEVSTAKDPDRPRAHESPRDATIS